MSGGHAHVENAIWMRSLLMAGIFLTIGVVAYGVLVGGIGVLRLLLPPPPPPPPRTFRMR